MRVLYLCPDHGLPVFGRKGCSTHVREVCRALSRRGHEVLCLAALLVQEEGDEPEPEESCGFRAEQVPHFRQKWMGADMRLMLYNYRLARACTTLFQEFSPDLVYERYSLYGSAGGSVAQRAGVPYMMEVNTRLADEQANRLHFKRLARRVERGLWRSAPALVAVSAPVKDELASEGVPAERVRVMPMAVDPERFSPRAELLASGAKLPSLAPEGWLSAIYAGALTPWHGVEGLFGLASKARERDLEIRVVAVGGMPRQVEELAARAKAEELEPWLKFHGSVPYSDVPLWLAAADAGFLPETSKFSSPTKMFEYMAAGLPIVAPRLPAIEEVIRPGENGLLFEPGDPDAPADQLASLLDAPQKRLALGAAAREDARTRHSWDNVAEQIEDFREEIIQRGWL